MVLPNAPVEWAIAIYSTAVWGAIIFFPNHRKTRQYMNTALPLYPLLIAYGYFAVVGLKPMRLDQVNPLDVLFGNFFPLQKISFDYLQKFYCEGIHGHAALHMLCFNLFVGRAIYWEGIAKRLDPYLLALVLFLIMTTGPLGLGVYYLILEIREKTR